MTASRDRGWCSDCFDREACATGWSCLKVRAVAATADADTRVSIYHTAVLLLDAWRASDRYPEGLLGDLLFLILGPEDRRTVRPAERDGYCCDTLRSIGRCSCPDREQLVGE